MMNQYTESARPVSRMPGRNALIASLLPFVAGLGAMATVPAQDAGAVHVYSARKEALIQPLLERFENETGIDVSLITGDADELLKRLETEGDASPADVLITVDAGRLNRARELGVLQPVASEALENAIPPHLRDAEGYWFGLSKRARTIFYAKDRVSASELSTYEALADEKWKGRVCIRSSNNIYNQSLVASMLATVGEEATEQWARGLTRNFAQPPTGGDTDQLKAAAAGVCDLAIANTYYYGRMLGSDDESTRAEAEKLAVFWPNQAEGERGVHVNVSGAGVTRSARRRDNAIRLVEFLASPESQRWYAEVNLEYPVIETVEIPDTLKALGNFRPDMLSLADLGKYNRPAVELMDRVGWK